MPTTIRRGDIVIGGLLILIGSALLLSRLGLVLWDGRWALWPAILLGLGVARLVESPRGGPYRGLLLIIGGLWLLGVQAGWLTVDGSWPILVIGLGLTLVAGSRRSATAAADSADRPGWHLTPLAIVGLWFAVFLGARSTPGLGSYVRPNPSGDRLQVITFTGESSVRPTPPMRTGEVVTLMGQTRIDLEAAAPPDAAPVILNIFTMWGQTIVRAPNGWVLEPQMTTFMGSFRDRRANRASADAAATPAAPHVRLRGLVTMGEVIVVN